ncbi:MAG: site-specific tyrosine recombinase/integron integrase [Candidatus Caldatribacteriaceae bacterium]
MSKTTQDVLAVYGEYLREEKRYSPHTIENYLRTIDQLLQFLKVGNKEKDLLQISSRDIGGFFVYLKAKRGLKRVSQVNKLSALRNFYRFLRRRGFLSTNPCDGVSAVKIEKKLPLFLTIDEMEKIFRLLAEKVYRNPDFKNLRNLALFELLYSSGLRVGELTQLTIQSLDLSNRMVKVRGKGGKERIVPFNESTRKSLVDYLDIRVKTFGNNSPWVFLNCQGKTLTSRGVRKILDTVMQEVGIVKKVSPHVFRHSFATHFLAGQAELRIVQEALGHSSLSTTQIYTHLDWERMKTVYERAHPHSRKVKKE